MGVLALLLALLAFHVFASNPVPWEDASILFRYSENVASGHGIVYNPGGERVDGATDMLFMLCLAVLNVLGIRVEVAAALLNAASLALMASLVYASWRRWGRLSPSFALIPCALVLMGPVWQYGQLGFGTPTFAAACTAVALMSESFSRHPARRNGVILGVWGALAGLVRPEGFILAGLILAAQALRARSWRVWAVPAAVLFSVAVLFVAWRTLYFGYPFPNPFYKKGGGTLHLIALVSMAKFVLLAGVPVIATLMTGLAVPAARRRAAALLGIFAGWTAAWLLMSDEMNVSYRFQFAILPVLVVLCAPLFREIVGGRAGSPVVCLRTPAVIAVLVGCGIGGIVVEGLHYLPETASLFLAQVTREPGQLRAANPHAHVAEVLHENLNGSRRTLATTEAGYVAWKSGWTVTDLWGLNDKKIAHEGYLNSVELGRLNPEIIFAHVPTSNRETSSQAFAADHLPGWTDMTEPLLCYSHRRGYMLLGQWGDEESFVVLARPDLPDLEALRAQFAAVAVGDALNSASVGALPTPLACSAGGAGD